MSSVNPADRSNWSSELAERIRETLRDMRFGTVTLIVQDGRVIQIDRNEKIRFR